MRRPVALATAAVVAAMLVPAGAAVADPSDPSDPQPTTTTEVTGDGATTPEQPTPEQPTEEQPVEEQPPVEQTPPQEEGPTQVPVDGESGGSGSGGSTPTETDTDSGSGSDPVQTEPEVEVPAIPEEAFVVSGYLVDELGVHVAEIDRTLSVEHVGEVPAGVTLFYAWYAGGEWRSATSEYTPSEADYGKEIRLDIAQRSDAGFGPGYQRVITQYTIGGDNPNPTPGDGGFVEAPDEWTDFVYTGLGSNEWDEPVAVIGETITALPTTNWEPGTTFEYEWRVDGYEGPVRGEGPSYVPGVEDLGREIYLVADPSVPGSDEVQYGAGGLVAVDTIAPKGSDPVELPALPRGDLQVSGIQGHEALVGQTLSVSLQGWVEGTTPVAYRWKVDGVVRGTAPTFTPEVADLGKEISVEVDAHADGFSDTQAGRWLGTVLTKPTVLVPSTTVAYGSDAALSVTVAGVPGGPTPTGAVDLWLTPQGGQQSFLATRALSAGAAPFSVSYLPTGSYAVEARYLPDAILSFRTLGPVAPNAYTAATGTGVLTVTAAVPTITAPATVNVSVATRASFEAKVSATDVPMPGFWTVREGGTVLAQGEAWEDGTFTVKLPVLPVGSHSLVIDVAATKWTAAASRTVQVVVAGEPAQVGAVPTAELETPKAATAPGQQMELVAEGFQPGETVAFYLHSDPVFLGTAVADANGIARLLADIPANVPAGAHTVMATGGTSGRWASLPVTLAVPVVVPAVSPVSVPVAVAPAASAAVPSANGDLAVTGSQSGAIGLAAGFLVAVGGALVVATRRARATR
ncbi:Ig-like domain-containing protein [Cellulomonas endometrii]|uniref:Ig-like domain-containing protein n=1 Tax=Cellulomonas endometrii TaxID=3036301 RepID=UPI0024ADC8A9|nr:hypothetical protein [Cellulomonas endometrii]